MMADTHIPPNFDERVLVGINARVNDENKKLFQAWRRVEGGTAKWNPLNSTLWVQNFTDLPDYNDIKVRNYTYESAGVAATILTFASRNSDGAQRYGGIKADLQAGTKTARQIVLDRAGQFRTWGTDVDLLLQVIDEL
jgi:hypothetical protein